MQGILQRKAGTVLNKQIYVKDIQAGDRVQDLFLVTEKNMAISQKGNPYLNLKLRDKTGEVDGRVWDRAAEMNDLFRAGDIIHIQSQAVSFRNVVQLSISRISVVDDPAITPADYLPSSASDTNEMFEALMQIIETVQNPHLKALLNLIFSDEKTADAFRKAPAAKGFHHAYIGGLLEHTLSVARLLDLATKHYNNVNRDLVMAGGILHDIGKIHELSFSGTMDYTDEGRLVGHIVLAVEFVDAKIAEIENFPKQLALELRHILLSHHGVLEFGSPKRPKTVEALIVNYMDDLDAKVNAFEEFMNGPRNGSNWTPYHRLLERYIYNGPSAEEEVPEEQDLLFSLCPGTEYGGPDPDNGRALFHGDPVIRRHPHGEFAQIDTRNLLIGNTVSQLPQGRKVRSGVFGIFEPGRHRHEAPDREIVEGCDFSDQCGRLFGRDAALALLAAHLHLDKDIGYPSRCRGSSVKLLRQAQPVDGVDHIKKPDGVLGLVRLQMADHVPFHIHSHRLDLPFRLLDVILPHDIDAGLDRFQDSGVIHRLGHSHQPDRGGITPRPQSRLGDLLPYPSYVVPYR